MRILFFVLTQGLSSVTCETIFNGTLSELKYSICFHWKIDETIYKIAENYWLSQLEEFHPPPRTLGYPTWKNLFENCIFSYFGLWVNFYKWVHFVTHEIVAQRSGLAPVYSRAFEMPQVTKYTPDIELLARRSRDMSPNNWVRLWLRITVFTLGTNS